LDTVAHEYINYTLENEIAVNKNTEKFIDKQVEEITKIIDSLEFTLNQYKENKHILDLSREQTDAFNKLAEIETQREQLLLKKSSMSSLEEFLIRERNNPVVPPMNYFEDEDESLKSFIWQLFDQNVKRSELLVSVKEGDPRIARIDSTIKTIKNNIFRYTRDNKVLISEKIAEIDQKKKDLEYLLKDLPKSQRELLGIERKLLVNENLYTFLLEKKANTIIARAAIIPQTSIIEKSRSMGVVGPDKKAATYTFVGIGLLLSILIGFIRLIFFERIENTSELKTITKIPIIGGIPHHPDIDVAPISLLNNPRGNVAEAFRSVRTNLQYVLNMEGPSVIMVSSIHPSEGKTFVSINLGSVLAKASKKVLILDYDMHKPRIHKIFGIENITGVSSYLVNRTHYTDSVFPSQIENLDVIPAGPVPPNASELVLSDRVRQMIEENKQHYDFLIIDTPPISLISDSMVIFNYADLGIFVMNTEKAIASWKTSSSRTM
jgi:capsular exopolysaccharide synthesis family protein